MTKVCVRCNEEKSLEMFAKGKNYKDGRRGTCKKCHTKYVTNYYNNNPDKKAAKNKMNTLHKPAFLKHGLNKDTYQNMLELYGGKCYSCKDRVANCIDHDHSCCHGSFSCGKCVRGLLCSQCNTALGLLQDSRQKIQNLLEYIK